MVVLTGLLLLNLAVLVAILVATTGYRPTIPDCQEDEAIWWVADDERGCVNVEELAANVVGLPVEVVEQRLPLEVAEQGLNAGEGILTVGLTIGGLWLMWFAARNNFFWYDEDEEQELVNELIRKGRV